MIDVLSRLPKSHRMPAVIQVDNGTELPHAACLNTPVFELRGDAKEALTSWWIDCNAARPCSALGMLTLKGLC